MNTYTHLGAEDEIWMTRYTNLCHDMRRKRRKQSITANRRKWCKISIFKEFLRHDKNIIHLPRQVSWRRMYYRTKWGRTGYNVPKTLINTTV